MRLMLTLAAVFVLLAASAPAASDAQVAQVADAAHELAERPDATEAADAAPEREPDERADLCIIRYTPRADFQRLSVVADLELTSAEMQNLTDDVDADRDGVVTQVEVDIYENASRQTVSAFGYKHSLVLDENWATQIHVQTRLTNFVGPVASDQARLVSEHRTYSYPPSNADRHVLRGGLYAAPQPRAVIEFVVIEAPAPYKVTWVNGQAYNDGLVELPAFDTEAEYTIVFERPGRPEWPIPIPPTLAFAAVAAALLLAIARRAR
jgi:hypothetical protein